MQDPYRHSVWVDVFTVLLFGTVLLGGAGYLLYHAGGAAGRLGGGRAGGESTAALQERRGGSPGAAHPPDRFFAPGGGTGPLLGDRSASAPTGTGAEAPFSESWQEQATPNLEGPAFPSNGGTPGGTGDAAADASGPSIASARSSGGTAGGEDQRGSASDGEGSGWRAEAQRLSGRARALSRQLGQMARESSGSEKSKTSAPEQSSTTASASRSSANSSSAPDPPGDPSQVPIGGLGWLAAAGAAYALRRLGSGGN